MAKKMREMTITPTDDGGYHVVSHSSEVGKEPNRYIAKSVADLSAIMDKLNTETAEIVDPIIKKAKDKKSLDKFLVKDDEEN